MKSTTYYVFDSILELVYAGLGLDLSSRRSAGVLMP